MAVYRTDRFRAGLIKPGSPGGTLTTGKIVPPRLADSDALIPFEIGAPSTVRGSPLLPRIGPNVGGLRRPGQPVVGPAPTLQDTVTSRAGVSGFGWTIAAIIIGGLLLSWIQKRKGV